jgi:transcriptional regulator with XRE-family HTH domain
MANDTSTVGARIQTRRKLAGMSQKELARASGISLSTIRNLEQDAGGQPRTTTLHSLAEALRVRTSALLPAGDADPADPETAGDWLDVREALYRRQPQPDELVTAEAVLAVLEGVRPDLAANRYAAVRPVLPLLIRDAWGLEDAPQVKSRVLNLTAWLLVQTRQWEAAAVAAGLAQDVADDRLDAAAAVNTACWSLLRQGRLADARRLAVRHADAIEPRFSRASKRELALWGRLLLGVTNAAVRDNRPGEAREALSLAQAAATRIRREIEPDGSTTRTFGPVTVAMIAGENMAITRRPDKVLEIARGIPPGVVHPSSASRCRHRLDVANALVMLRRYPEAVGVMRSLRDEVPEWLVQQRYARDIVGDIVSQRRSLSSEMRDLAVSVRLPL